MIPTIFTIPSGYYALKTGDLKVDGDLFLNRVCQQEFQWAWCKYTPSGTDWNTIVGRDETIIRPIKEYRPLSEIIKSAFMEGYEIGFSHGDRDYHMDYEAWETSDTKKLCNDK